MALYLTTTGTQDPVIFADLGARQFSHPTTDHEITLEFTEAELAFSADFQSALSSGHISLENESGGEVNLEQLSRLLEVSALDKTNSSYFWTDLDSIVIKADTLSLATCIRVLIAGSAKTATADWRLRILVNSEVVWSGTWVQGENWRLEWDLLCRHATLQRHVILFTVGSQALTPYGSSKQNSGADMTLKVQSSSGLTSPPDPPASVAKMAWKVSLHATR